MLSKMQRLAVNDTMRISVAIGNAVANTVDELTRKDLADTDCLEELERLLTTIEYKVDEIRQYSKNY